jgi:hypothetical protein
MWQFVPKMIETGVMIRSTVAKKVPVPADRGNWPGDEADGGKARRSFLAMT